jgi:hypothetical protein
MDAGFPSIPFLFSDKPVVSVTYHNLLRVGRSRYVAELFTLGLMFKMPKPCTFEAEDFWG